MKYLQRLLLLLYQAGKQGRDLFRAILTKMDLTLPVTSGRCALGTWQGVYLYEHRSRGYQRQVTVTVSGD